MTVIFWAKNLDHCIDLEEGFKPSFGRLLHKQEDGMGETSEVSVVWDFTKWSMEGDTISAVAGRWS